MRFFKKLFFICLFSLIGFQANPIKPLAHFRAKKSDLIAANSAPNFWPDLLYAKSFVQLFLDCLGQEDLTLKQQIKHFAILAAIVNLNCLISIFIHEVFGHYLVGRLFGLKPKEVSTGRHWTLFSSHWFLDKTKWPTDFRLKILPSGGVNKSTSGSLSDPKKILYFLAGPTANLFSGLLFKKMKPRLLKRIEKIKDPIKKHYLKVWLDHLIDQSILLSWFNLIPLPGFDGYQIGNTILNHRGPWKWS